MQRLVTHSSTRVTWVVQGVKHEYTVCLVHLGRFFAVNDPCSLYPVALLLRTSIKANQTSAAYLALFFDWIRWPGAITLHMTPCMGLQRTLTVHSNVPWIAIYRAVSPEGDTESPCMQLYVGLHTYLCKDFHIWFCVCFLLFHFSFLMCKYPVRWFELGWGRCLVWGTVTKVCWLWERWKRRRHIFLQLGEGMRKLGLVSRLGVK